MCVPPGPATSGRFSWSAGKRRFKREHARASLAGAAASNERIPSKGERGLGAGCDDRQIDDPLDAGLDGCVHDRAMLSSAILGLLSPNRRRASIRPQILCACRLRRRSRRTRPPRPRGATPLERDRGRPTGALLHGQPGGVSAVCQSRPSHRSPQALAESTTVAKGDRLDSHVVTEDERPTVSLATLVQALAWTRNDCRCWNPIRRSGRQCGP